MIIAAQGFIPALYEFVKFFMSNLLWGQCSFDSTNFKVVLLKIVLLHIPMFFERKCVVVSLIGTTCLVFSTSLCFCCFSFSFFVSFYFSKFSSVRFLTYNSGNVGPFHRCTHFHLNLEFSLEHVWKHHM